MLGRVIVPPRLLIGELPLRLAHLAVRGADVLDVVDVEVRIHRSAGTPELLVVLRAGERRETEELDDVDRQLALDDLDVALD